MLRGNVDLAKRVEYVDDIRRVRFAFRMWQNRIENKKRREMREGVRRRFSLIRKSVDTRVLRGAFQVCCCMYCFVSKTDPQPLSPQMWLLAHKLKRTETRRNNNTKRLALVRWHDGLQDVRSLLDLALRFQVSSERLSQLKVLDVWRSRVDLKMNEKIVTSVIGRRLKKEAWEVWVRTRYVKMML